MLPTACLFRDTMVDNTKVTEDFLKECFQTIGKANDCKDMMSKLKQKIQEKLVMSRHIPKYLLTIPKVKEYLSPYAERMDVGTMYPMTTAMLIQVFQDNEQRLFKSLSAAINADDVIAQLSSNHRYACALAMCVVAMFPAGVLPTSHSADEYNYAALAFRYMYKKKMAAATKSPKAAATKSPKAAATKSPKAPPKATPKAPPKDKRKAPSTPFVERSEHDIRRLKKKLDQEKEKYMDMKRSTDDDAATLKEMTEHSRQVRRQVCCLLLLYPLLYPYILHDMLNAEC